MYGTAKADVLYGTSENDKFYGMAGDDALFGGGGADYIDGGIGDDFLVGGDGNDVYVADSYGDLIVENDGEGTDEVRTALAAYALGANLEILRGLSNSGQSLTGNALANTIIGAGGKDRLYGGDGNDSVNGGDGDDVLSGGAGDDTLNGATGTDTASYVDATSGVTVSLAITKAQVTGGAGKDTLASIENLEGSAFADVLTGSAVANRLDGGLGADQLFGGDGDDVLIGSLRGSTAFDVVDGGAGYDTAIYRGASDTYSVRRFGSDILVAEIGGAGADILRNVEAIIFADGVVRVDGYNNAPLAIADTAILAQGERSVAGNLLANDRDLDDDALTVVAGAFALAHGTITISANGDYTYAVDSAFFHRSELIQDRFDYQVSDGRGGTASATLIIDLPAVLNNAPSAGSDSFAAVEDTPLVITASELLGNDADPDGDALSLVSVTSLVGGIVSLASDGSVLFRPDADFHGTARFAYTIADPSGLTASAEATVLVASVNDAPVVTSVPTGWTIQAGQSFSLTLPADVMVDSDGGEALRYSLSYGTSEWPSWAAWDLASRTLSGTAPADANGTLRWTLIGTEPDGATTSAEIIVGVEPFVPPPPVVTTPPVAMTGALIFVQRSGQSGGLAYTGDAARVLKSGQVVVDWTEGGTIAGIPQGEGYTLEVRTGTKIASAPLAVGVVVATIGQSNMVGAFSSMSAAYSGSASTYTFVDGGTSRPSTWKTTSGPGALAFADTLRAQLGDVPIAFTDSAIGGTRLTAAPGLRTWSDTGSGSLYQDAVDDLYRASGGRAEIVLWSQGEQDGSARVTTAAYATALKTLMAQVATDMGNPYFIISGLSYPGASHDAIRLGQMQAVRDNPHAVYVPTAIDIETIDGTHLTSVSHAWRAIDAANAALAYLLPESLPVGSLSGTMDHDSLYGTMNLDRILGGGGNDTIFGMDGADILRGQAGNDVIDGGTGNDSLSGGSGADLLIGANGNDDLFGDDGSDILYGGEGNDQLAGGIGGDVMYGGAGDDSYVVDTATDVVSESGPMGEDAGGTDHVSASVSYVLPDHVENLTFSATAAITGMGNAANNILVGSSNANLLTGLSGDDRLVGQAGDDTLVGGDGADRLEGGLGSDRMFGGAGDDWYVVDAVGDVVDERDGADRDSGGADTVQSTVSFVLPNFVETLLLYDNSSISGTGNDLANLIRGNGAANTINGAGGDDVLQGGAGDDTLRGGTGADTIQGQDGRDRIVGGVGVDRLTGDATTHVADRFVFESIHDSGVGAGQRDVITDFDTYDFIDLSLIDADVGTPGQQHLVFVGTSAFSRAGQVRAEVIRGGTIVEADVNGDGIADLQIELANVTRIIAASQFIL